MKNRIDRQEDIERWIVAKILGQALEKKDEERLKIWLEEDSENRELFERLQKGEDVREWIRLKVDDYGKKQAALFAEKMEWNTSRHPWRRFYAVAGSIAAVVTLAAGVWLWMDKKEVPVELAQEQHITPGSAKAVLTLADGRKVNVQRAGLDGDERFFIDTEGNEVDLKKEDEKQMTAVPAMDSIQWNVLSVPTGGEFFYTLSDGTQVWLNSASEIRFPSSFSDKERRVYLKGEAFFDVRKKSGKPFIVDLEEGNITVYGTRFNISDYDGEPLSAVLTEGSIGFSDHRGVQARLKPADRLLYNAGKINIQQVDTTLYTAWIHRMFIFKGQTLEEIMNTLSRWYDIDVVFTSEEIKHIRLSGRLNRYQDVRVLLNTYSQTAGIAFDINGRNVIVSKK